MQKSDTINELAAALAKAQGGFTPVQRSGLNPHLKNKYVMLDDVLAMIKSPMMSNGLSFSQLLGENENGQPSLTTILMHASGEWLATTISINVLPPNRGINEMQSFGSSITYVKRYQLMALLGIATEDDDDGQSSDAPALYQGRVEATKKNKLPVSRDAATAAAVIEAGLTENTYAFAKALKKSTLPADADKETVLGWFTEYRRLRDAGANSDEAAEAANAWYNLRVAMAYTTDSGKVLGKLSPNELTTMVEQIDALEAPSGKMLEIKQHCLTLLDYLATLTVDATA